MRKLGIVAQISAGARLGNPQTEGITRGLVRANLFAESKTAVPCDLSSACSAPGQVTSPQDSASYVERNWALGGQFVGCWRDISYRRPRSPSVTRMSLSSGHAHFVDRRKLFAIGSDEAANQFGPRKMTEAQESDALVSGATFP